MTHVDDLNADQIRALADELQKFENFKNKQHQRQILEFAIESFANRDPMSAISHLKSPSDGLTVMNLIKTSLPAILMIWHQRNAEAARCWILTQIESGGGFVDGDTHNPVFLSLTPFFTAIT